MPSIKRKTINYDVQNDSDEDPDAEKIAFLKEKVTLKDYLKCPKTREILEKRWFWKFCKRCEKDIWNFYEQEQIYSQETCASILFHDNANTFAGHLSALVFDYIEPQYDLTIFYDFPHLAQPLIDSLEDNARLEEEERKRRIRENYEEKVKHKGKTFSWATKSYK